MHAIFPTVYRLLVHLPNEQMIYYDDNDNLDEVLNCPNIEVTALTAWFAINRQDPRARNTLYLDFPKDYSYDKKKKRWTVRRGSAPAIGRMHFASPVQGERFYL